MVASHPQRYMHCNSAMAVLSCIVKNFAPACSVSHRAATCVPGLFHIKQISAPSCSHKLDMLPAIMCHGNSLPFAISVVTPKASACFSRFNCQSQHPGHGPFASRLCKVCAKQTCAATRTACCLADLVGSVSQRIDVEVIRDGQEGNAVKPKYDMSCLSHILVLCSPWL